MATTRKPRQIDYPSGDGKPVAETPLHRDVLFDTIAYLRSYFANDPMVYISGNMFVYYVRGNRRKHVAPDVFVARGIPDRYRDVYLTWEEGKGPDIVIEITSSSTRNEDLVKKRDLYRDVLQVHEYFLFDPLGDYLEPPLRGFRLVGGEYVGIEPVAGRLPSEVLDLHLERQGRELRLFDPATGAWLLKEGEGRQRAEARAERLAAEKQETEDRLHQTEDRLHQTEDRLHQTEAERQRAESRAAQAETEAERLRRELDEVRRRLSGGTE